MNIKLIPIKHIHAFKIIEIILTKLIKLHNNTIIIPVTININVYRKYCIKYFFIFILKEYLYKIYGSHQKQVVIVLIKVPIKIPIVPQTLTNISEAIILIRASAIGLYLSSQYKPVASLKVNTAFRIPVT